LTAADAGLALGVIVCCRDEERAIARRLANLARSKWPASQRPHRIVVVNDGSADDTQRIATTAGQGFSDSPIRFEVITNHVRAGKSGAIISGLERLGPSVDLVVLTDADVVHASDALLHLATAFLRDPRLGMACGGQTFVQALLEDGSTRSLQGRNGGGVFDRLTALVRRIEARSGRTFSVHGQLLAWRARLELVPRHDLAADDLDLMRQARLRGARVELIQDARFFEVKPQAGRRFYESVPEPGALRTVQAVRRARAYLQFVRNFDVAQAGDAWTRWQWRFYKYVPMALPWIALASLLLLVLGVWWICSRLGPRHFDVKDWRWLVYTLWLVVLEVGGRLWWMCSVVVQAKHLELEKSMEDRWSTAR